MVSPSSVVVGCCCCCCRRRRRHITAIKPQASTCYFARKYENTGIGSSSNLMSEGALSVLVAMVPSTPDEKAMYAGARCKL
jgi:hypothetical protein